MVMAVGVGSGCKGSQDRDRRELGLPPRLSGVPLGVESERKNSLLQDCR